MAENTNKQPLPKFDNFMQNKNDLRASSNTKNYQTE